VPHKKTRPAGEDFKHKVCRHKPFSTVLKGEQFLDRETQGLPHDVGLPAVLAIVCKSGIKKVQPPNTLGSTLHAPHLAPRLEVRCDYKAPAGPSVRNKPPTSEVHVLGIPKVRPCEKDNGGSFQPGLVPRNQVPVNALCVKPDTVEFHARDIRSTRVA
jgi:hypothetical protein